MALQESIAFDGGRDELDDLFNYDPKDDDVFKPVELNLGEAAVLSPKRPKPADLGIDEEIQITKKRKPIPKLDQDRLLSEAGIPKLRRMTRDGLKFKGKGHEFSDVSNFLDLYQLWLDDLYPRAKFSDGINLIEKFGHTQRMQMMRREWISESKVREPRNEELQAAAASIKKTSASSPSQAQTGSTPEKDTTVEPSGMNRPSKVSEESLFVDDDEVIDKRLVFDGDELDALLAEDPNVLSEARGNKNITQKADKENPREDDFANKYADEMEMMADLEDW